MNKLSIEISDEVLSELEFIDSILFSLQKSKRDKIEKMPLYKYVNKNGEFSLYKFENAVKYLQKKELIEINNDLLEITYKGIIKLSEGGFSQKYITLIKSNQNIENLRELSVKNQKVSYLKTKFWFPYSIIILIISILGIIYPKKETQIKSKAKHIIENAVSDSILKDFVVPIIDTLNNIDTINKEINEKTRR